MGATPDTLAMNPFLSDEIEALRGLVRTWPNAKMVVLGAAALRCFMPMAWRTTEDLDLTVAASIEDPCLPTRNGEALNRRDVIRSR